MRLARVREKVFRNSSGFSFRLTRSHEERNFSSNDGRAISRQAKRGLPRRAISRQKRVTCVSSCAIAIVTFDIGLHEVCVRVGVRYVITKFSRMDS